MKIHTQAVQLSHPQPAEGLVKRGALVVFRALRLATDQAKQVPGVLAQASADVREAWRESARPNA
ncbi:MAG: hypothetical protein KF853_13490 [Rhodocyclaceae bacterium]|nr:hypothetical protein [Rhodocyclaceae bacterium]MBX3678026.1 hypothetical protein [Rhodocyclaceae bacterium]MCO5098746.1 hypothetical protein [Rhodocyclaceae bacterium]